ncbi:Ulp1 protease family, C-terminal catalytic domain [Phytophthora cactorum]|nr:Ulp1 protease family, C-terminal catalytic domain [Phytophthora cactorum]
MTTKFRQRSRKKKQEHEVTGPPESKSINHGSSVRGGEGGTHGDSSAAATAAPVRQVEIIIVPKSKRHGRPRTTTKQLRQTKLTARLAVHTYPSGLTVSLDQLLTWARSTPNLKEDQTDELDDDVKGHGIVLDLLLLSTQKSGSSAGFYNIKARPRLGLTTESGWSRIGVRSARTIYYKEHKKTLRAHVYMYELLIDEEYREDMGSCGRGSQRTKMTKKVKKKKDFVVGETPQQPDSSSCGVLVVAQTYKYISGDIERQTYNVSKNDIKVMRLRMLWVIMHSKEQMMSDSDAATATEIDKKLQVELK